MKINIVMGYFLPVPPVAGGATEKSWFGLAREFVAAGHEVTLLSRCWPGLPEDETPAGFRHVRLRGYGHTRSLPCNLLLDAMWSWRVWRELPPADITIVNTVALPIWLGRFPRGTWRVVVMTGRMPKGQYRIYGPIDRIIAGSAALRLAVVKERPRFASIARVFGCPIDWGTLAGPRDRPAVPTIGFVGRLHREKGLDLLVDAIAQLGARKDLGPWRVVLCGPADVARGGSGDAYAVSLESRLRAILPRNRYAVREPLFDPDALAALYREIDVFCYPSLAAKGETFGVAVLEAMAAGAVPVVSRLECFSDFLRSGQNGEVFDHTAPDAATRLAQCLANLILDPARRTTLAQAAQADAQNYDFPRFAARLLKDFSTLK